MTEQEKDELLLTQVALMFQTAALQQMGKLKSPFSDAVERDLGQARISIDILDVLHRRMKGNLSDAEERMFANVLRELRLNYVDELEKDKRGLYAGCVGYFSAAGEMDTCIVLRTALVKDGKMYVQAGAGIVADSDPAAEQQECVNKAKALFRAAEEARRFASGAARGQ